MQASPLKNLHTRKENAEGWNALDGQFSENSAAWKEGQGKALLKLCFTPCHSSKLCEEKSPCACSKQRANICMWFLFGIGVLLQDNLHATVNPALFGQKQHDPQQHENNRRE
jgi:hypothetical protein